MNLLSVMSTRFLSQRWVLWLLFWSNLLGTIYGYYWYKNQLIYTWEHHPAWQLIFVPDSPTASLFFTISIGFLLFRPQPRTIFGMIAKRIIEALGVVTSIKYGIWACVMIVAGAYLGSPMVWQDWMLIGSHLAMAVEGLLFVRLFAFGSAALTLAACWTWLNDTVDYSAGVYPWLPYTLVNELPAVCIFTFTWTGISVVMTWLAMRYRDQRTNISKEAMF
ncbi:Uncharacterized membrane protein YpjA [Paenibacillus sp. cl6col]|uniref:DUF1405 domain-containing protein n=1 Tax=Paenibacillus sp. cl6col TaxID=1761878 RepID=UPI000883DAD3|nr:DUF1405 domain-containing protein [Paenibacillus sp. cl6col]SDE71752.1 Uncharacterized membrane protein YpjA [Paenibacillus sp. cl6col]